MWGIGYVGQPPSHNKAWSRFSQGNGSPCQLSVTSLGRGGKRSLVSTPLHTVKHALHHGRRLMSPSTPVVRGRRGHQCPPPPRFPEATEGFDCNSLTRLSDKHVWTCLVGEGLWFTDDSVQGHFTDLCGCFCVVNANADIDVGELFWNSPESSYDSKTGQLWWSI